MNSAGTWNVVGTELLFAKATSSIRVDLSGGVLTGIYEGKLGATYLTVLGESIDHAWIKFNTTPAPAGGCSSLTWYTGSSTTVPSCQVDARTVALHEWGHAVSLRHSGSTADVMYTYSPIGSTKRVLTTHDKDGIRWLY